MDEKTAFDRWASSYDQVVHGLDKEYAEVFQSHENILKYICSKVSDETKCTILEIGSGTGNLTRLLNQHGFRVICVEPSNKMRKVAQMKAPNIPILDGHFLSIPLTSRVDAIVTSFAFHHLTLKEKEQAITYLGKFLNENGKIVVADVMFESEKYRVDLLKDVKSKGAFRLLKDLETKHYEYLEDICELFRKENYTLEIMKMNKYVWVLCAMK
ncbi:MAG: class I SAM-dependent methyltransferase [Bacillota bacterium]